MPIGFLTDQQVLDELGIPEDLQAIAEDITDAKARANHTGTQTAATISDLAEAVQDLVGAMVAAGAGITVTYDDVAGTLTVATTVSQYTDEMARDALGAALTAGAGITVTPNDGADTITIASTITQYTDEMARDALGTALTAGAGITITPDDGANTITIAGTVTQYTDEMARDALAAALTAGANITITPNDGADTITIAVSGLGTMATQNANAVAITGGRAAFTAGAGLTPMSAAGVAGALYVDFAGSGISYYDANTHQFSSGVGGVPYAQIKSTGIEPGSDNNFYLGKNDDDGPLAWKGVILKDQAGTGKYYRVEVNNNTLVLVDLTD